MARILVNSEWYNELSVDSLYETEFERLFLQEAKLIFPDYHAVPFKAMVESQFGKGRPDLAIVEKNYQHWYVIEVEKSNHSLEKHVLPQISIFATAEYNDDTAKALKQENKDLDFQKLQAMIRGQQPKILVIVDAPRPEWIDSLRRWECSLSVFQIFRSARNKHVYRLNGFTPKPLSGIFSECYIDRILKRHLIVLSPALIEEPANGILTINYNDSHSLWRRIDLQNRVVLCPLSMNPLDTTKKYQLHKKYNNSYLLTEK